MAVEATTGPGATRVRYGLTRAQRGAWIAPALLVSLLVMNWPLGPGPAAPVVGWQVTVVMVVALVAWAAFSRPGLDIEPGVGFTIRGFRRQMLIPFHEVLAVERRATSTGECVVIHSRLGSWSGLAPARAFDPEFSHKVDRIRQLWAESGARAPEGGSLVGWGPDPSTAGPVAFRITAGQVLLGRFRPSFLRNIASLMAVLGLALVVRGELATAAPYGVVVAAIGVWLCGPRTVVRADGVELRYRWTRSTFVPWSMVSAVTLAFRSPNPRSDPGQSMSSIRLITASGYFELPAPFDRNDGRDPEFWRKVDFIERSWAAHRGATWIGPPAPPPLPPPPRQSGQA